MSAGDMATTLRTDIPVEHHDFRPRRVRFDYASTPDHWVPDDPHTTHVVNVLHLLLPAGERWFCEVYRDALPLIEEEPLRRDVKAFIGQEATHARAHDVVLDHLAANGVDPRPFTRLVEFGFRLVRPRSAPSWFPAPVRRRMERWYLLNQLAGIAAIEHFTAVMGWWIVSTDGLDRAGADPEMLALLRWHGAEEVEHRSVAFEAYRAAGGGYIRRCLFMLVAFAGIFSVWMAGTSFLMHSDPNVRRGRMSIRQFLRAGRQGRLPTVRSLAGAVPRYLRRDYHPLIEGDTAVAVAYLDAARGVVDR